MQNNHQEISESFFEQEIEIKFSLLRIDQPKIAPLCPFLTAKKKLKKRKYKRVFWSLAYFSEARRTEFFSHKRK